MARRRTAAERIRAFLLAVTAMAVVAGAQGDGGLVAAAPPEPEPPSAVGPFGTWRPDDLNRTASGALASARRVDPPQRRVLMVGDSTLAAVRNVTASQELFVGFDPVLDAQGCRRLVWPSCWSDSDFRVPNTVEEAILETPGELDVVVVMSGYNDWNDPFGSFVDTIMAAARSKGADQVVFLTLSVGQQPRTSATAIGVYAENTIMLWESMSRHPDLVVADWRTYNQRSTGWLADDGVHLDPLGAFGLADYLTRWIAHLDGQACPEPLDPGGVPADPCPDPNTMTRVPDIRGLYAV